MDHQGSPCKLILLSCFIDEENDTQGDWGKKIMSEKAVELRVTGPNFSVKQPNAWFCLPGYSTPSHHGSCKDVFPSTKDPFRWILVHSCSSFDYTLKYFLFGEASPKPQSSLVICSHSPMILLPLYFILRGWVTLFPLHY